MGGVLRVCYRACGEGGRVMGVPVLPGVPNRESAQALHFSGSYTTYASIRTMKEIGSGEARSRFRELLTEVEHQGGHIAVLRHNIPAAVWVPVEWYERAKGALEDKSREEQAMTAIWVAYDAISGDVTDSGPEHEMKAMLARVDRETKGQHTVCICAEKDWRRNTEGIRRGMSGNPPRRHPQR